MDKKVAATEVARMLSDFIATLPASVQPVVMARVQQCIDTLVSELQEQQKDK